MKKIFQVFTVFLLIIVCGCSKPAVTQKPITDIPDKDDTTDMQTDEDKLTDTVDTLKEWLDETFSFQLSCTYNLFPYAGFSQETLHEISADGGIHHITTKDFWNDYDKSSETREYYYRYEGSDYVCYLKVDDEAPIRMVLSSQDMREMDASLVLLTGPESILPDYLTDFTDAGVDDETGLHCFTYLIPLRKAYNSDTMLSVPLYYAYAISGTEFSARENVNIGCKIEAEKDTLRPVRITYDFSELKPIVLSNGALSAEYALNVDLMYLKYTLDYELQDTFTIPDTFIP